KKMLIQVLRNLERDGLVHREVFQIVPPKTEYTLTDLGRRLHEPISLLCQWAADHVGMLEEIEQNRRASTSNSQRGQMRQCSTNRCRFGALALAEPAQKAPLPGEKQLQAKIKQLPAK